MYMVLDAQMAKSDIPSIVVQTGCTGSELRSNGSLDMDGPHRQLSRPSRLAKQEEIELEEEGGFASSPVTIHIEDGNCKDEDDNAASCQAEASCDRQDSLSSSRYLPGDTRVQSPDNSRKGEGVSSRSAQRVKLLVRSQAVHDDTSPPPPEPEIITTNTNTLTVTNVSSLSLQSHSQAKGSGRHLLAKQGSSQGTGSIEGSSPSLSRDSSTETYTDSTGIDLQQFIVDTLHKSQKDRLMLLKIEQDLITLVKDYKCQSFKFSAMSSYNRMLVHRVAAFFGLEHNVDKTGNSVIVNKTKNTRIPDIKFQDQIRDELVPDEPKKLILKRDSASFEEGKEKSPERQSSMDSKRSKSFEEREEEYEKARARIFNQDSLDILLEGYGESPYSRSQDETLSSRRSSQEDLRWVAEPRPWSSTDSDSSGRKGIGSFDCESALKNSSNKAKLGQSKSDSEGAKESLMPNSGAKPTVTKASSFGGISVLVSTSSTKTSSRLTKSESLNTTSNVTVVSNVPSTAASSIGPTGSSPLPSPNNAAVTKVESNILEVNTSGPDSKSTSINAPVSPKPVKTAPPQISSQTGKWESNVNNQESEPKKIVNQEWATENKQTANAANNPTISTYYGTEKTQSNNANQSFSNSPSGQGHFQVPSNQPSPSPILNTISPVVTPMGPQASHSPYNPGFVYFPFVGGGHPQQNTLGIPPPHPISAVTPGHDGRHMDGAMSELNNQMAGMSFGHGQAPGLPNHNGLGSHPSQQGNSMALDYAKTSVSSSTTQSYYVPSDKGQSFLGQQPNTQLYYIHQLPPPMRYLCTNQPVQAMKGADGMVDCGHPQSPSPHMTGQQILPGYSLVFSSQNSDNLGYSTTPYNYLYVPPQPGTTPPSNNATLVSHPPGVQHNPNSVPVYNYSNMLHLFGSASGAGSLIGPQNSSQLPLQGGGPQFGPPPPGSLPGPLPMCVLANGTTNSNIHGPPPNIAQGGNPMLGSHYGAPVPFRPQTPPTQSGNSMGNSMGPGPRGPMQTVNNQSQLAPFVSYAFFSPPMHHQNQPPLSASSSGAVHVNTLSQSNVGQPSVTLHQPGTSGSLQSSTIHPPSFMTAFQVFRPGISSGNVRNSTPPPSHPSVNQQNIIPIQLPTPPPQQAVSNHGKGGAGSFVYPVSKSADSGGHGQHQDPTNFKGGNNPKTGRMSGPLHVAPTQFRMPGPMYRSRPLSLMQDVRLVGHPLQQQLSPLLFPPQPRGRFPPPQITSPSFGPPNLAGRGPKSRKQRTRWTAPGTAQNSTGGNNTKGHPNILHHEDIYNRGAQMLIVESIPENMKRADLERYLETVVNQGAKIQFFSLDGNNGGLGLASNSDFVVNLSKFQVYAVFENENAAQNALLNVKTNKFQLRSLPSQPSYHRQQHTMVQTHRGPPPTHTPSHHHHRYHHHHKEGPQSGNKSIS